MNFVAVSLFKSESIQSLVSIGSLPLDDGDQLTEESTSDPDPIFNLLDRFVYLKLGLVLSKRIERSYVVLIVVDLTINAYVIL